MQYPGNTQYNCTVNSVKDFKFTGLQYGSDQSVVSGELKVAEEKIVETIAANYDRDNPIFVTVTGSAVVACQAGVNVYVEAAYDGAKGVQFNRYR